MKLLLTVVCVLGLSLTASAVGKKGPGKNASTSGKELTAQQLKANADKAASAKGTQISDGADVNVAALNASGVMDTATSAEEFYNNMKEAANNSSSPEYLALKDIDVMKNGLLSAVITAAKFEDLSATDLAKLQEIFVACKS